MPSVGVRVAVGIKEVVSDSVLEGLIEAGTNVVTDVSKHLCVVLTCKTTGSSGKGIGAVVLKDTREYALSALGASTKFIIQKRSNPL